jgi:protein-S-isoprenylcysteine O-methyltransferase Ste14
MYAHSIIVALWIAVAIFWLITALSAKQTVRRQTSGSRTVQVLFTVTGYFLVFSPGLNLGLLGYRLIPYSTFANVLGLALTAAGAAIAIWARIVLAGNWSSDVTVKENHALTTRGPYRLVRHPIYSGLLLAVLATAVNFGLVRCFVGWLCVFTGFLLKLRVEEQFMAREFGEQYQQYRQHVKALIPGVF